MALTKITFLDKVRGGTAVTGKGRAEDWNEIKQVTNELIDEVEATSFEKYTKGHQRGGSLETYVGNIDDIDTNSSYYIEGDQNPLNSDLPIVLETKVQDQDSIIQRAYGDKVAVRRLTAEGWQPWVELASTAEVVLLKGTEIKIGTDAGSNSNGTNIVCLGANSQATASDQIQLGDPSTTTFAYGAVQDRSDLRDKAEVQDCHLGLDFLNALKPRSYKFDYRENYRENKIDQDGNLVLDERDLGEITTDGTHRGTRLHCGLIAQEVKEAMDYLGLDFAGYQNHLIKSGQDVQSIGYSELIAPLISAVQELSERVKTLEDKWHSQISPT